MTYKVAWPRGKAWVCKTFYGGSSPPTTSGKSFIWQAIVRRGCISIRPHFILTGHPIDVIKYLNIDHQPIISQLHARRQAAIDFRVKAQLMTDMRKISPGYLQLPHQVD